MQMTTYVSCSQAHKNKQQKDQQQIHNGPIGGCRKQQSSMRKPGIPPARQTWAGKYGYVLIDPKFFFSSSVADVALMARSLHESKQKIHCTRTKGPQNRKPQPNKKRRPANPPARFAFRQGNSEANSRKQNKTQKTGPEPKQKLFFPSDAFVASARSFNMFKSMLQLGLID